MSGSLVAMAIEEVHALHAFFAGWFRAGGPHPSFAELEQALAPDFRMIAPNGVVKDRAAVISGIRAARGTMPADFAIVILQPRQVFSPADWVLLEFIERQYRGGETTQRQSSALLTVEERAPRGLVWRHLHETWIPQA